MRTEILNIHTTPNDLGAAHADSRDVYCGRAGHGHSGYFGNPISLGRPCPMCRERHVDRESLIRCYELYLAERLRRDDLFAARVMDLSGRRLWCFCAPLPCHAEVLAIYADALTHRLPPPCLCARGLTLQCRRCFSGQTARCECDACEVGRRYA